MGAKHVRVHRSAGDEVAEPLAVRLVHHDVEVVVPGQEAAVVVEAHEAALEYGVSVVTVSWLQEVEKLPTTSKT